ncbi:MAG: hypothetical protein QOI86_1037 [Actinomycetota bacterium]|nr:hypothetical protein [Actinomycetota bacterium]
MILPIALIGKLAIGLIVVFVLALIGLFSLLFRR